MVRIMNPQDNEVPLKKNSVIGTFELSNLTPHMVMEVEEESEESNYAPVRRQQSKTSVHTGQIICQ